MSHLQKLTGEIRELLKVVKSLAEESIELKKKNSILLDCILKDRKISPVELKEHKPFKKKKSNPAPKNKPVKKKSVKKKK